MYNGRPPTIPDDQFQPEPGKAMVATNGRVGVGSRDAKAGRRVFGKVARAKWPVICLHRGSVGDSRLNEGPGVVVSGRLDKEDQPGNQVHGAEAVPRK